MYFACTLNHGWNIFIKSINGSINFYVAFISRQCSGHMVVTRVLDFWLRGWGFKSLPVQKLAYHQTNITIKISKLSGRVRGEGKTGHLLSNTSQGKDEMKAATVISIVTPGVNSRVCHCLVISGNLVFEIICSWEAEFIWNLSIMLFYIWTSISWHTCTDSWHCKAHGSSELLIGLYKLS